MMEGAHGVPPRRAAWTVLLAVSEGTPFDLALETSLGALTGADRRLAHELAAGTLRTAGVLDREIDQYVDRGLDTVPRPLRQILRLGAYQLMGLDRVPPHAAVSTTVALARETGHAHASGFVNAVLRKVADNAPRIVPGRGSHPGWLVDRWTNTFGSTDTAALCVWNDTRPMLALQPARWSTEQILQAFSRAEIGVTLSPFGAGLFPDATHPTELPGFSEGGFIVQDPAQQLVIRFAAIPANALVYDACAAPGGKTVALGRTAALVVAGEARRERIARLRENLARAGSGREHVLVANAVSPPIRPLDAVVVDAPCLGTGVLARHPDARWRVSPDALATLSAEAAALLQAAATQVRPGGLLCFSTCSLEPEENSKQVDHFLAQNSHFVREASPNAVPDQLVSTAGDLEILPQRHAMDGAFAARLRRVS